MPSVSLRFEDRKDYGEIFDLKNSPRRMRSTAIRNWCGSGTTGDVNYSPQNVRMPHMTPSSNLKNRFPIFGSLRKMSTASIVQPAHRTFQNFMGIFGRFAAQDATRLLRTRKSPSCFHQAVQLVMDSCDPTSCGLVSR